MVDKILEAATPAAEALQNFEGKIRLIGQYDADGISATTIAHELLQRMDKEFEYEILKQLYEEDVKRLAEEDEELLFFVDIGSGQSKLIQEEIIEKTDKQVVVSDHHQPQIEGDFAHLNPHFKGIDGGEAISAAGTTYLLGKKIDEDNKDLAPYALIGATGDIQKQEGEFLGLNQDIADEALENKLIKKRKGLDLYGRTTKPLHKSLMYTSDPHLEGVTNDETGAIHLVKEAGIELRENGDFRTLADLTEQEEKQLINQMIVEGYPAQQLLNNIYTLENGYEIGEFATVINACGRLGKAKEGVKILLNNDLKLAKKISNQYGRKISKNLRYVENNRQETIKDLENITFIDGKDQIEDDFIGTVTTIMMSNNSFEKPVTIGIADSDKDKVKISTRADKKIVENGFNLGENIEKIAENLEGEGGGHGVAAGAKIPQDKKQEFIDKINNIVAEQTTT